MDPRPMFPLGTVLVPAMVLPLHVFEPRYRALVRDCQAGDQAFGVVLIERGSEVGGGDQRADVGTLAEIVQVDELPDGRYGLVAVGTRRIRVREWRDDDPYPRAHVEEWPDEPAADPDALTVTYAEQVGHLRRLLALAVELGASASALVDAVEDPVAGSHQLGMLAGLGPFDRQRLLAAPGPEQRLALLDLLLSDAIATLETQLGT